jgi:hypothetical protein
MIKQWGSILCSAMLIASGPVAVVSLPILLHPSVAAVCAPFTAATGRAGATGCARRAEVSA